MDSPDTPKKPSLVIVCVKDHPKAITLLRTARARAQSIGGRWISVFVETPADPGLNERSSQERMLRLLTLAEQMGSSVIHLEAQTVDRGIAHLLEKEKGQIAQIIVGYLEPAKGWWSFRPSAWERITKLARNQNIAVEIVPLSGQNYHHSLREKFRWFRPQHIFYALISVGVAQLAANILRWSLPHDLFQSNLPNIGLLFMIACAFSAGRFGLLPGLVASLTSCLAINYFFIDPDHLLRMNSVTDVLNIAIFLASAILISLFTSQTRGFAEKSTKRELGTQALFTLYRIASVASSKQEALEKLQEKLQRMLEMEIAFFMPPTFNPTEIEAAVPANPELSDTDKKALELCWKETKTTGVASSFLASSSWRFEPMLAPGGEIGVIAVRPKKTVQLDAWFGRLLSAIADQTASVVEHIDLERSVEATHIREEREKLRSMLLSSVSHDLKTPLASIIGALGIYRNQGMRLSEDKKQALLDTAMEEAERLDSFITNILDMTRLESGKIQFRYDWHDMSKLVREVTKRMQNRTRNHEIVLKDSTQNLEVYMDYNLTGQVLQNVIDNACKYAPAHTRVEMMHYIGKDEGFYFEVRDYGTGLPPEKINEVFDKYARLQRKDSQVAGTGLGLAICKAIMETQGGLIQAGNHPEGGAVFTFYLPKWRRPAAAQASA